MREGWLMIDIKFGEGSRGKKAVVARLTSEGDEKWKDERRTQQESSQKTQRTEGGGQTGTSTRNKRKM